MRGFKRSPRLFGLGMLLAIPVLFGGQAKADVHTDQGGSLILFPKVVADGSRDTVIKITNKSNMQAYAHCFYTNALGSCTNDPDTSCLVDDDCAGGGTCDVPCEVTNFDVFLTAQQPTFWRVSTGRFADITTEPCEMNSTCSCSVDPVSGALICPGFDPGAAGGLNSIAILGTGEAFNGELRCYQTEDDFETPVSSNSLIGEAVLTTLSSGEQSQYNAITIEANPAANVDNSDQNLLLNNTASVDGEYNACPSSLVFTHYGDGADELVSGATVSTELTLVPCTVLYSEGEPVTPVLNFYVTDQLEFTVSAEARAFQCHFNRALSDISTIFDASAQSTFLKTRIVPDSSNICLTGDNAGDSCDDDSDCPNHLTNSGQSLGCRPSSGVLGVVEQFYSDGGRDVGSAAWSITNEGERSAPGDIMSLPPAVPIP